MLQIKDLKIKGYHRVIEAQDTSVGLHCFIAIHDCTLGPATGGTRVYPYLHRETALEDALRLAKAMTYKTAAIPVGFGGGKGVIIADPNKDKTEQLWISYAEVVNSLKGEFITGENMGTNIEDIKIMRRRTPYVAAYSEEIGSGDPSRFAAWGVFQGMRAVAKTLWKTPSLHNKEIFIQGLGHIGNKLANFLFWEGAKLLFSDVNHQQVKELAHIYGAKIVPPEDFATVSCDIFAPCAKGEVITVQNISQLSCKAIAGGANNQLEDSALATKLKEKGILYAPDFIINAGGVINVAMEFEPGGYDPSLTRNKVNNIYDRLLKIFDQANRENKSPHVIAEEMAEYHLKHQVGKRTIPIFFNN